MTPSEYAKKREQWVHKNGSGMVRQAEERVEKMKTAKMEMVELVDTGERVMTRSDLADHWEAKNTANRTRGRMVFTVPDLPWKK